MCEIDETVKSVIVSKDQFKEILTDANQDVLGRMIMALDEEMESGQYETVKYWERNAVKSYAYVYQANGTFATAKIAHNVRILLMEQFTLTVTALARKMISGVKII